MIRLLVLAVLVGMADWLHAASVCRVLDPELTAEYVGSCNASGLAEGKGIARGKAEYVGEFKAGKKHGQGVKQWPWGDRYIGDFIEDHKDGFGIYLWGHQAPNAGDSYAGQFSNDQRHGNGAYQWVSGERYEGLWENNQMRGAPTPMAIQRGRHHAALREAVLKVGAVVCRQLTVGIGTKEWIRGVVAEINDPQLSFAVKLDQALPILIDGKQFAAGDVFWDSAVQWEPCQ